MMDLVYSIYQYSLASSFFVGSILIFFLDNAKCPEPTCSIPQTNIPRILIFAINMVKTSSSILYDNVSVINQSGQLNMFQIEAVINTVSIFGKIYGSFLYAQWYYYTPYIYKHIVIYNRIH